jgi:hypothetical protein
LYDVARRAKPSAEPRAGRPSWLLWLAAAGRDPAFDDGGFFFVLGAWAEEFPPPPT